MSNNVCIVESSFIVSEGLKEIVASVSGFKVTTQFTSFDELEGYKNLNSCNLLICNPDLIKSKQAISKIRLYNPHIKFLIVDQEKNAQKEYLNPASVDGYIFLCCDTEEVLKAMISVAAGEKFFCEKALDNFIQPKGIINSCNPISLSEREIEVLQLIAKGKSSKQISEVLYLSFHTITTHRKHICRKLNLNKVSELVSFAHNNKLV